MSKRYETCPFCHEQEATMCQEDNGKYHVVCQNCWASGPECDDANAAEECWNERCCGSP